MKNNLIVAICVLLVSCGGTSQNKQTKSTSTYSLDEQAHRGGRGLLPENTIAAMIDAIDRDVTTLELDLQITKDMKVIVSHDPYFNERITTTPEGKCLTKEESRATILHNMTYEDIKKYDVGMKSNPDFPDQKNMEAVKPLLSELIAEAHAKGKGKTMFYNIEIKTSEKREETNRLDEQFETLGFVPHTYSPHHAMVSEEMVVQCHAKKNKDSSLDNQRY